MKNAFIYLRVSDISQVKGDGFPRQEKACRDYAKSHHYEIVEVFKEDCTGTEASRPVLAKLMVSLEQNGHNVKTVIIEKLDRLARDLMVQEAIVRDFKRHGINLVSTMEGEDLLKDDPTRKLIRQIFGAIAEYDKSMLVAKLKASRERKRARGGKADGRYGYRETEDGQILIRHINQLYRRPSQGKKRTLQQIADILNSEGQLTMDGKQWTLFRVQQTIKPYKRKRK